MNVETVTWRGAAGWSDDLPEPDGRATLVMVFADDTVVDAPDDPLGQVHERWRGHAVAGCSTAGQFAGPSTVDGAVVTVVRFDECEVRAVHLDLGLCGSARRAGRDLADLLDAEGLRSIMVLADGLGTDGSLLATGIADVCPAVDVWGALAADGSRFVDTWNVVDGATAPGMVSAVGFYGSALEIGHGRGDGWHALGPERVVTTSIGRVVHQLDGRATLTLYEDYLGPLADDLPGSGSYLPMSVRDLDDRVVVRSPVGVDRGNGSVTMAGDVTQGSTAQLLRMSVDGLLHGAELAAKSARIDDADTEPHLAVAFSGVGRRMSLGERADEEPETVRAAIGNAASLVGCWTYGELGPDLDMAFTGAPVRHDVHNQTMTITTLRERSDRSKRTAS
jgi:hypothetical protein